MGSIKVGDRFESTKCGWYTVTKYESFKKVTIRFDRTGYTSGYNGSQVLKGCVLDKLAPIRSGVGFMGVGKYTSKVDGVYTGAYQTWANMIERCYGTDYTKRSKTYEGCSTSEDWHNFQNFADYYNKNYKEGYHLDKDLLIKNNKIYSAETCVFVPRYLNAFVNDHRGGRGGCKIGVYLRSSKKGLTYVSQISSLKGVQLHLGHYATEDEAYSAWLDAKLHQAFNYKEDMDKIDDRIYPTIVNLIKTM